MPDLECFSFHQCRFKTLLLWLGLKEWAQIIFLIIFFSYSDIQYYLCCFQVSSIVVRHNLCNDLPLV